MADVDEPISDCEKVVYLNVFACQHFFKIKHILITFLKVNLLSRSNRRLFVIVVCKQGFFIFFFRYCYFSFPSLDLEQKTHFIWSFKLNFLFISLLCLHRFCTRSLLFNMHLLLSSWIFLLFKFDFAKLFGKSLLPSEHQQNRLGFLSIFFPNSVRFKNNDLYISYTLLFLNYRLIYQKIFSVPKQKNIFGVNHLFFIFQYMVIKSGISCVSNFLFSFSHIFPKRVTKKSICSCFRCLITV